LYYLTDGNHCLVRAWMTTVDQTSKLDLQSEWVEKLLQKFDSARVSDDEMCQCMQKMQALYDYYADPHTCVALAAAEKLGYIIQTESLILPVAILATASPCKFEESCTIALGEDAWQLYKEKMFPNNASEILTKEEKPPILYYKQPTDSLSQAQLTWESQAKHIISNCFR
jgi:threonine synthase